MAVCWRVLDNPLLALHFGIAADFVALIPTFKKSWSNPQEESSNVFMASAFAGLLGVFAAINFSYQSILLPAYLLLANSLVVVILLATPHKKPVRSLLQ